MDTPCRPSEFMGPGQDTLIYTPVEPIHYKFLYHLLADRPGMANISHEKLPSYEEHCIFCFTWPERYRIWRVIESERENALVGSIYVTMANEIGIQIDKQYNNRGYATRAIKAMMNELGPGCYLANIAPQNLPSMRLFSALNFDLCQYTYRLRYSNS